MNRETFEDAARRPHDELLRGGRVLRVGPATRAPAAGRPDPRA